MSAHAIPAEMRVTCRQHRALGHLRPRSRAGLAAARGRTHESVPIYNTCAGYAHVRATKRNALFERTEDWSLKSGDMAKGPYEDVLAFRFNADKLAKSLLGEGIRGMKIWPFDVAAEASNGTRISGKDMEKALEPFAKIRDAVGSDMEIMVELHGLWTLPCAMRIAEALKPYDVAWLEEPICFNELDAMAELARHTSILIAASERLATRQVFKQLIDKRAASIIMIDLAWCGGLKKRARSPTWRSERAARHAARCTGPIVYAASCALLTTLPNVNYQEAVRAYFTGWVHRDRGDAAACGEWPGVSARWARPRLSLKPEVSARRRGDPHFRMVGGVSPERHERQSFTPSPWMAKAPACGWPVRSRGRADKAPT
jgi:L-alanine-DL-glutamate epimerase-like enolase superfamily enzyme